MGQADVLGQKKIRKLLAEDLRVVGVLNEIMHTLRRLCRNSPFWVQVLTVGILAAAINGGMVWLDPPVPDVHDEFSYLLAADTFLSGRLTNPSHPHWPHFETMHVIHQPSYASKYPPAQGLLLALGTLLGHPLVGVCLSTGLAAASCTWMLRAWLPKHWAVTGGLLVALHSGVQLKWGMSYWGGALAFTAGAMTLGAAGRLSQRQAGLAASAIAFGIGCVLLAITRPFEGAILVLASALVVLYAWNRDRLPEPKKLLLRVALPTAAMGISGIALLVTYNLAVTGDPFRMPYQVHEASYGSTPLFLWQQPDYSIRYRHDPLARYHLAASMWWFNQQQTWEGLLTLKSWLTRCSLEFFLPMPAAFAMLAFGWVKQRKLLPWLAIALLVWGAACLTVWMFPHYLAPVAPLLILAVVAGLRSFRMLERRLPPVRRWITPSIVMLQAMLLSSAAYARLQVPHVQWQFHRQTMQQQLEALPGKDVIFVRYRPDHNVHDEWVYNRANIDESEVVWARELGPEQDANLREYFKDRRAWLVFADEQPIRLVPYGVVEPQ